MPRRKAADANAETVETEVIEEITEAKNVEAESIEVETAVEEVAEADNEGAVTEPDIKAESTKTKRKSTNTKAKNTKAQTDVEVTAEEASSDDDSPELVLMGEKTVTVDTEAAEPLDEDDTEQAEQTPAKEMFAEAYDLSQELFSVMENAILNANVLWGTLSSVTYTELGPFALVVFEGNENVNDTAIVHIGVDDMGITPEDVLYRSVISEARRYGKTLTDEQIKRQIAKKQFSIIKKMIGARVPFVPVRLLEDTNFIIGSRKKAMKILRYNFKPRGVNLYPKYRVGSKGVANVIRVYFNYIVVEFSGYEVVMSPRQITPYAVNVAEDFHVGDTLNVVVRKVTENAISLMGTAHIKANIAKKVQNYRRNSVTCGVVYFLNKKTGTYLLKLPDKVQGVAHCTPSALYNQPRIGDEVRCFVLGPTKNKDAVNVYIKGVIRPAK